jgi:purine catabolism regulatory family protein/PucR-like helix-turn-helix protein/diguanylate cyclase with GGDEF domain
MATVRQLVRSRPDLVVRAGEAALDREIRWPHVSELMDPTPYLSGGELVLSAGVHLPRRKADIAAYAGRLARFGVAGLGFGIDPIHHTVPPALVLACEQHGLPLLEVPPSVPFIAITEALATEAEARHLADLRRLNAAQRALVAAAARPSATAAIVRRLADELRAGVLLVEPTRGLRWSAGTPAPDERALAADVRRVTAGRGETGVATHDPDRHVVVAPVHGEDRRAALVIARGSALSAPERGIVSVGASLLSLLWRGLPRQAGLLLGAAVVAAATGAPAGGAERTVALAVGAEPDTDWCVVVCAPRRRPAGEAARERWRARLRAAFGTPLLDTDGDHAVLVVPEAADPRGVAAGLAATGAQIGVSAPHRWTDLPAAAGEARRALATARITGRPPGRDTGELLGGAVDPGAATGFAETTLAPVLAAETGAELLATLRTWLEQHGSWDRAAAVLGVHRNTVRNRISRVTRLLGSDLDDPDVRWQLLFALRWLPAR